MSKFSVPDMSCGHCKATIETALLDADAGAELSFDMEAREVEVDSTLATAEVLAAMKDAGYPASEIA
ncbi:heavy-metal-associated domain-containing protein [Sinisalibacter aestuarii]|uniref:Heavy metal transport/detoxification protein n=1 Tax=Sinisalibacter aestuarii TaxID=2949426 RepID=A0ABQ5LMY4_9RHOB|nr:heavy-metal-associated domain-containing protein [Sinisalibacter aestuarii]GKY86325.1 heavy metal transport/detoxification protein [Sinisalibacter aestuarii]